MGRTKKTESAEIEEQSSIESLEPETPIQRLEKEEPANVLELMRLYPQYEKIWVTPKGFVHPEKAPKYLLEGAILYSNKFYNN